MTNYNGLNYKHFQYYADMLIMANNMQLLHLAAEALKEAKRRRELPELPRFKEVK